MRKCLIILSCLLFILPGCGLRVLDPASDSAKAQSDLIYFSFALMVVVSLTVFVLLAQFVYTYRDRGEHDSEIPKQTKGHRKLEITWTVIPILIITILAVPTYILSMEQSPNSQTVMNNNGEKTIHVEVQAQQFEWNFVYENGKTTKDRLILPAGYTAVFHVISKDVIHSFWVPKLGGKVDALPDRMNVYRIEGLQKGKYLGKCAEFCGTYHTLMRFSVEIIDQKEFQEWLRRR